MADGITEDAVVGGDGGVPLSLVAASGCATILLASSLAYALTRGRKRAAAGPAKEDDVEEEAHEELDPKKYPGGHLSVYYGSQTGTAESFAQQIAREGEDTGFKVRVVDLEETEEDLRGIVLDERTRDADGRSRAVFLMSTYGEGEPTDNAAAFFGVMKGKAGIRTNFPEQEGSRKDDDGGGGDDDDGFAEEKKGEGGDDDDDPEAAGRNDDDDDIDPKFFDGMDYLVFGLGNRQYEHFVAMGKLADFCLNKAGANRLAELGIGDDDDDLEADFEKWKDEVMWPLLKARYVGDDVPAEGEKPEVKEKLPACPYVTEYLPKDAAPSEPDVIKAEDMHTSTKHYFTSVDCPVSVVRELRTKEDPGSTVHLEIDISKAGDALRYNTADNLGVLPVNDDSIVESVAKALSLDLDAQFRLKPARDGEEHRHAALFPTPCSVRECLARYCDLTSAPRRSELKLLAAYARDPLDRTALLRMASKEGKAEYKSKIMGAHVGIADIVTKLCPSISMPLEHFVALCPRMLPRYYTISSSSSVHPDSVHITVSLLTAERPDGSIYKGVCSHHLAGMVNSGTVRVFNRDSSFRLPSDPSRPIIMIGPGTGVAPMRALLQERSYQRIRRGLNVGENVLYFGCKRPEQDYIYEEEMRGFQTEGTLTKLRVAFSRRTEKKVYVQHLLGEDKEEIFEMIDAKKASVYVCGGVKMGADVSDTLRRIVSEMGGMSPEEAKAYVDKMASGGRFVQELWA